MKFDYCIGNPPYQVEAPGTSTSDKPVYHDFMEAAYTIADKVELITPARFLFNAGATPKAWNEKMLADEHLKILDFHLDSKDVFQNVGIAGGVAISYSDANKCNNPIRVFTSYNALQSILNKVVNDDMQSIVDIITTQSKFNLDVLNKAIPTLHRTDKRLESNIFSLSVFRETPMEADDIRVIGLNGNERAYRYIGKEYIEVSRNLNTYKIVLPKSYGTGINENSVSPIIGQPVLLKPHEGYTRTFIGIGFVNTESEAIAIMKYVKSKFARTMLAVLKVTQDNNPEKWKYVPLQDFTSNSDINWNKSISDIDKQLYQKYGLSDDEINFIETHVKEK